MDIKKLYDKYYTRLAREGMLKALFSGLTVGFAANFLVAFLCWYFDTDGLLWSLLTLAVVTAATTPLFYLKKYKPNARQVAKRLDRLGLEERMITMTELDGDESYIAQRQREDAQASLHSMDTKKIRFIFPKLMIVAVAAAFLFGGGMTTVSGLRDAGIISSGRDVIDNVLPEEPVVYVTISYVVGEGEGIIEDDIQIIPIGENTEEVVAVADEGFVFVQWSDGATDPVRKDYNLQEDTVFEAVFEPLEGGEGEGDGEPGEGEGQPGEGDKPSQSDKPSDPDADPNNGANGAYEQNDMVKDGNTPYRDIVEAGGYYEAVKKWLETAEGVPEELKSFVETYFDVIV